MMLQKSSPETLGEASPRFPLYAFARIDWAESCNWTAPRGLFFDRDLVAVATANMDDPAQRMVKRLGDLSASGVLVESCTE